MPSNDRLRRDNVQGISPVWPKLRKQNPEYPIGIRQLRSWLAMFHGRQLLTEQQILKCQIAPAPGR
jgi:hypothetical protein